MRGNQITYDFAKQSVVDDEFLYQWDYGQKLIFTGIELPQTYEVHFTTTRAGATLTMIGDESGVDIPDVCTHSGIPILFYIFLHTNETDGETVYAGTIPVKKRPKPSSVTPSPEQQSAITQAIAALNSAVDQAEAAEEGAVEAAKTYPLIRDGIWYVYDAMLGDYVSTGISATGPEGPEGPVGPEGELEGNAKAQIAHNTSDVLNLKSVMYGQSGRETQDVEATLSAYNENFLTGFYIPSGTEYTIQIDSDEGVIPATAGFNVRGLTESGTTIGDYARTDPGLLYLRTADADFYGFRLYRAGGIAASGTITVSVTVKDGNNTVLGRLNGLENSKMDKPEENPDGRPGLPLKTNGDGSASWRYPDGYITPEMFGAVGDGQTDDYSAFVQAVGYAVDNYVAIKLVAKSYYLSDTLELNMPDIYHQLVMYSDSVSTLIVNYNCSPNSEERALLKVISHVTLKNIHIKPTQNGTNTNHFLPSNLKNLRGLWIYGSRNTFENVEVYLCYTGFYIASDRSNGCAYNLFETCRSRNNAVGFDIYAYGSEGYCNEMTFINCEIRIDDNYKTVFQNSRIGYDNRYAIYIRSSEDRDYPNNCLRFISCCYEGCFNGVHAFSSYCSFIDCRTDRINPPGKYYTFITKRKDDDEDVNRNGWNCVYGGYGFAKSNGTSGLIDRIDEVDENGQPNRNNYILYRQYPFMVEWPMLPQKSLKSMKKFLTADDAGVMIYDKENNRPLYWNGSAWQEFGQSNG